MKALKNFVNAIFGNKSEKIRLRSVDLALKSNTDSSNLIKVADGIYKYIKNGTL